MNFKMILTQQDWFTFYVSYIKFVNKTQLRKKYVAIIALCGYMGWLVFDLIQYIAEYPDFFRENGYHLIINYRTTTVDFLLFGSALLFVLSFQLFSLFRLVPKKLYPIESKTLYVEKTCCLQESSVLVKDVYIHLEYSWEAIKRIAVSDTYFAFISDTNTLILLIEKQQLTQPEIDNVYDIVNAYWQGTIQQIK